MTKRILAIVMALVMSMTLLSVNVFAAVETFDITNITQADATGGKTVTFSWDGKAAGADHYVVSVTRGSVTVVNNQTTTKTSYSFTANAAGTYDIRVKAYKKDSAAEFAIGSGTCTVFIAQSFTGTNGLKVEAVEAGGVRMSWNAIPGASSYYIEWTYSNGSKGSQVSTTNSYYASGLTYADLRSVAVYQGNATSHLSTAHATGTNSGLPLSPSTPSGPVYFNGTTLYWTNTTPNQVYTIKYSNGYSASQIQVPVYQGSTTNNGATRYYSVASIISQYNQIYGSNYGYLTFEVVDANNNSIGTAVYSPYSSPYGTTGYITTATYNGFVTLTFYYPAATGYVVYNSNNGNAAEAVTTNVYNVQVNYVTQTTVTVYAQTAAGGLVNVGTVVIAANGAVISNSAAQQTSSTQNSTGVSSSGCTMRVGTTSSTVYWTNTYGYSLFYIAYTNNVTNETSYQVAYTTSATIPLGSTNCRNFTVTILGMTGYGTTTGNQSIGYATYVGANDNTPSKSETKGLKLTAKSSSVTTVSWDPVDNASYYRIMYQRLDTEAGKEEVLTKTSFDLPMGKNISYQVYVWAVLTTNRTVNVGSATHIKGDDYPSETTTTTPSTTDKTDTTPEYVTNFKGTTGSKKITLSWSAAKGNPTYTIYWKRTSASEWKKAGTTSKRSTTIKGLNNGVSYDFKIVANGRDSGILTIAPSSSGTSTKTAADPSGSGTVSNVPVLKSAKGDKGKITASWNAVKNANKYSLWIAEEGTTKYKSKTVSWVTSDTSITISGVSAGTYKVRIKASTDNGKTWSNLGDCDYMTVTVS